VQADLADVSGADSLYVASQSTINEHQYYDMQARNPIFGFYSNILHNNSLRRSNQRLLVSGAFTFVALEDFFPLNIPLNDFVLFDAQASPNQQLAVVSNQITQDFNGQPITINYTLTTTGLADVTDFNPNGVVYQTAKPVQFRLNMSVSTMAEPLPGFPAVTFPILNAQDVVVSTQYFVNNIGVVHTQTALSYQLNPLIAQAFPEFSIPLSGSSTQIEHLMTYLISN
jgi:filamentous hemagglutinin family protein